MLVMPWLRQSFVGFLLQRPRFSPWLGWLFVSFSLQRPRFSPWLRQLVFSFSLQRPGFSPSLSVWGLWWAEWNRESFFSEYFGFALLISFHPWSLLFPLSPQLNNPNSWQQTTLMLWRVLSGVGLWKERKLQPTQKIHKILMCIQKTDTLESI